MRSIRIGMLLLIAALLANAGAPSASASPIGDRIDAVSKTYVDTDGVFHYAFDPSIRLGAVIRIVQGAKDAKGGCGFSAEVSGQAGSAEGTTTIDELTFDPATCESTLAVTESSGPLELMGNLPSGSTDASSARGGTARAAAASYSYWAAMYAYILDPVYLVTTSTKCIRYWSPNGTWSNSHDWYWFTTSGWGRTSSGVTNNSTTCDTRGSYSNLAFWDPTLWTYADHSKTKVVTSTSSGNFTTSYAMNKWGEKADWLSYHASSTHS